MPGAGAAAAAAGNGGGGAADAGASWPAVLRTSELQEKVRSARVLCVGAGGIGCELLKTLVCTGFRNIEVIDLDTIETSNLNRQFLFRKHHVGSSKAATASAVVQTFAPGGTEIRPYHANIKEAQFDVDFFKRFDLVLNGLDNLEARRHVNRLCLAAERPLVESGTAGYLGQVTVHLKGETECFECRAKPAPKSYPICTLRNTPDKPIHCIVWAKDLLFQRLFGPPEASDLDDHGQQQQANGDAGASSSASAAEGAGAGAGATAEAEDPSSFARREDEAPLQYAARVFARVYGTDIERLCGVKELWEKRAPPTPLKLSELLPDMAPLEAALAPQPAGGKAPTSASRALGLTNPNQKWSAQESAAVLLLSVALFHTARAADIGSAAFDKDDDLAVEFVTAAANLRSQCYNIPTQSLFDAKGMAGNIIHAIATTNAIISGLIVAEALKLLAGLRPQCRNTFLYEWPSSRRQIMTMRPDGPAPGCMVCGKAQLALRLNVQTTTLGTLVGSVLKKSLAINTPNLLCGDFMYEEGEGLEDDEVAEYAAMLQRPLAALPGGGLRHGSIVTVQDQTQHFNVDLLIVHEDKVDAEAHPEGFVLEGDIKGAQEQPQQAAPAAAPEEAAGPGPSRHAAPPKEDEDGVVLFLDSDDEGAPAAKPMAGGKRGREEEEEDDGGGDAKRSKATDNGGAGPSSGAGGGADGDDDDVLIVD